MLTANTAKPTLKREPAVQEFKRSSAETQRHRSVHEIWLWGTNGRGDPERRRQRLRSPGAHLLGGKENRLPAISEIRPQADHGQESLCRGNGHVVLSLGLMLELTGGEWIVVGVLFFGIVSASWWPRAGEWLVTRFSRSDTDTNG